LGNDIVISRYKVAVTRNKVAFVRYKVTLCNAKTKMEIKSLKILVYKSHYLKSDSSV